MNKQYVCELYFLSKEVIANNILKLALQCLGFTPKIMSIYISNENILEEVPYEVELLFSKLKNQEDFGMTIKEDDYDEKKVSIWFKFSRREGEFFSVKWSNTNLDFLIENNVKQFLKIKGFAAGYAYDNRDAWEQSRLSKEKNSKNYFEFPGRFDFVSGMQFMAAPLMWFGKGFNHIISKEKLLSYEKSTLIDPEIVQIMLYNLYDIADLNRNRKNQIEFWSFFELDKVSAEYGRTHSIDPVKSLNDFLSKMRKQGKAKK